MADEHTIEIERLAHGGDGVGRLATGKVVFVPGALPKEIVRLEVVRERKRMARGRLVDVLEPSLHRRDPECVHAHECGGCVYWHASDELELAAKADAAWQTVARMARLALPPPSIHASPTSRRYRSKARVVVAPGADGSSRVGFRALASAEVVDATACEVLVSPLQEAVDALRGVPVERELEVVLETAGPGAVVASVGHREGPGGSGRRALHPHGGAQTRRDERPTQQGPGGSGRRALHPHGGAQTRRDERPAQQSPLEPLVGGPLRGLVVGERHVGKTSIGAAELVAYPPAPGEAPPNLFRQANPAVNRMMVDFVRGRVGGRHLLELFCGVGNFTFALAPAFERITAVDVAAPAIETASAWAEQAELDHLRFVVADLQTETPALDADVVLLDPPRAGAAALVPALAACSANVLVYVSCDPATLGRDLAGLVAGGWVVQSVDLFDLFPRTAHVETVVVCAR